MESNARKRVEVELWCHHRLTFDKAILPHPGERLWCVKCQQYRKMVGEAHQWSVRCRDCRYRRYFGLGRISAETAAIRHRMRHGGHTVDLLADGKVSVTYHRSHERALPGMGLSPYDSDPPF